MDCLFCKIAAGQIASRKVWEDARILAFEDIHPAAPTHILLIPKQHISGMDAAEAAHDELLGYLQRMAAQLARERKLTGGYRIVVNAGPDAGQSVFHLHVHLLGGRPMSWPPG